MNNTPTLYDPASKKSYRLFTADEFAVLDPPPENAIRKVLHCKSGEYVEYLVPFVQVDEEGEDAE